MGRITISSMIQSPLQSLLRPAIWIPGLRSPHYYTERWKCDVNVKERIKAVLDGVKTIQREDDTGTFYDIQKVTDDFIRIFVFTRVEWLDIIEIDFQSEITKVKAFSSGFLPLCIPFACVFNVIFFWIPFLDMGMNKKRVTLLRRTFNFDVEVKKNN